MPVPVSCARRERKRTAPGGGKQRLGRQEANVVEVNEALQGVVRLRGNDVNDDVARELRVLGHELREDGLDLDLAPVGRDLAAKRRKEQPHVGIRDLPLLALFVQKLFEAEDPIHLVVFVAVQEAGLLDLADVDPEDRADPLLADRRSHRPPAPAMPPAVPW